MRILILLLALLTAFSGDDPKKKGREGNILYAAGELTAAADAYRAGIAAIQADGPGPVHAGLLNNLGAALYRQGDFGGAAASFTGSTHMSTDDPSRVRSFYNAGNALTKAEELESALDMYRQALLQDPSNLDAKFNYEFVKRQLQEQQQQQQQNQDQNQDDQEQQENEGEGDENQEQTDEENQDQQQQQDSENADQQNQDEQQDQQQQQQQDPTQMSPEEAQRILEALENEEEQLLRQVQKMDVRPRRVEKDW
jgi:tetratricopeptide (TPR) repeat protein